MSKRVVHTSILIVVLFSVLTLSCKQFDYVSPLPGVLEIHLRASLTNPDTQRFLPFSSTGSNTFFLLLRNLRVVRTDGSEQPIFSDLDAIRRNPDGDLFNCLDTRARDSVMVLGRAYFPPSDISAILLTMVPPTQFPFQVVVTGQYAVNVFEVRMPPIFPPELHQMRKFGQGPLNIRVDEGRTTRVTITIDLDATLQRRTEWFEYNPTFYVTSIQQF